MLMPDLILTNGRIFTANPQQPWATSLAIADGKIVALDDSAVVYQAESDTGHIDLGGRLVLPGLCDAHIHLYDWLLMQTRLNLATTRSRTDMLAQLDHFCADRPDEWIIGQGWNESRWGEQDFPTAAELDPMTGARPTLLFRSDMHVAVANHAALVRAGIDANTPDPSNGVIDRDGAGHPTGILRELAIHKVLQHVPQPTAAEMAQSLRNHVNRLHQLGITAVHDQRMKDGTEGPVMLAAYQLLCEQHALKLRINCNIAAHQLPELAALGLRGGFGNDWLRLGHVKVFADGSLGSRTAWMLSPFEAQSGDAAANIGVNVTPPTQMAQEFRRATQLGFPISVHAIGDRAIRTVLDIFDELDGQEPPPTIPHRIEHVQTIARDDIPRLGRLDLTASVQPIHLIDDRDLADRYLGDRAALTYAFRSLQDQGARLAFGSDAPVADCNPFVGIHAALCRRPPAAPQAWFAEESISLHEAICAYTSNTAHASGWQSTIGSLSLGNSADLIVLDRDLFELSGSPHQVDSIVDTQVLLTLIGGEIVHASDDFSALESIGTAAI